MKARRKWVTNAQLCFSAAGLRILLRGSKCVPGKQKVEILNEELMKMGSFPACCPFKFSFHGNRSGKAAWRSQERELCLAAFPSRSPAEPLQQQSFTEVFAIVIYAWNRSDESSWFLLYGVLRQSAVLLSPAVRPLASGRPLLPRSVQ